MRMSRRWTKLFLDEWTAVNMAASLEFGESHYRGVASRWSVLYLEISEVRVRMGIEIA